MNSTDRLYNYFKDLFKFLQKFQNKIIHELSTLTPIDEERLADQINNGSSASKKRWQYKANEEFFSKIKFILIKENMWHEWLKRLQEEERILLLLSKQEIFDPYIWLGGLMAIQERQRALQLQLELELAEELSEKEAEMCKQYWEKVFEKIHKQIEQLGYYISAIQEDGVKAVEKWLDSMKKIILNDLDDNFGPGDMVSVVMDSETYQFSKNTLSENMTSVIRGFYQDIESRWRVPELSEVQEALTKEAHKTMFGGKKESPASLAVASDRSSAFIEKTGSILTRTFEHEALRHKEISYLNYSQRARKEFVDHYKTKDIKELNVFRKDKEHSARMEEITKPSVVDQVARTKTMFQHNSNKFFSELESIENNRSNLKEKNNDVNNNNEVKSNDKPRRRL